ncbi:MAG: hypothetical protein ABI781_16235 [Burkholderiales bacterium]
MRMIVIDKGTDLSELTTRLLGSAGASDSAVQNLQRLNPHLDLNRLTPGAVVLVPDQPGLREGESASVGGESFASFAQAAGAALELAAKRVRSGHDARLAEQKDVQAPLKSPVLKRVLESDPDLKKQLDTLAQGFKDDQQAAKDSDTAMKTLLGASAAEFATLAKLLA